MLVEEVYALLRQYIDEPDLTMVNGTTDPVAMLKQGYRQFRALVFKSAPEIYELTYSTTLSNTDTLSLNNILLGATPTSTRAERITRVARVSSGKFSFFYNPVATLEQLYSSSDSWHANWLLQGTTLTFSENVTGDLKVYYLPTDTVDWSTGIVAGSNKFIDDLGEFHDLIALLATRQYAIRDYAINPVIEEQIKIRTKEFVSFLTLGRNGDASRWVQAEDQRW